MRTTLARDTIYSAIMLDINGLLGFAAIVGGLKHGEQAYNVDSSNTYLSMLMVALGVAMVIPDFINPKFYDGFMLFTVVIFISYSPVSSSRTIDTFFSTRPRAK